MDNKFKISICQMTVVDDKKENIKKATDMIKTSKENNSDIIVLPEMFNCPYENSKFRSYSEDMNGETIKAISDASNKYSVTVIAGSIPELDDGNVYNTCFMFDKTGKIIAKHRKMHLFDIDVPGRILFKESDILCAGNEITLADASFCKLGIGICYDVRFPEYLRLLSLKGAKIVVLPANFNTVTGPMHWELLMRMRAVDNQIFVVAASTARNNNSTYKSYGNSMVVDPWGNVLSRADEKEGIMYVDIDLELVDKVRSELPLLKHRRTDVYRLQSILDFN